MKRWIGSLLCVTAALSAFAQNDLPLPDSSTPLPESSVEEPGEIDPPLLIQSYTFNGTSATAVGPEAAPPTPDVAKLEADLIRAQKRAAGADRLFKAGIIAKVDAEQRALKVVQLEAAVAQARLDAAKAKAETTGDSATEGAVADAEQAAERALKQRQDAELEAALRNLQRQQKLLAVGSGRKADVARAEAKVAELQQPKE
jgi:hypothetical protein